MVCDFLTLALFRFLSEVAGGRHRRGAGAPGGQPALQGAGLRGRARRLPDGAQRDGGRRPSARAAPREPLRLPLGAPAARRRRRDGDAGSNIVI